MKKTASSAAPDAHDASRHRNSALLLTVLASTGTVVSLQQTLVLPLLPEFPLLLDTTADTATWLVTATLLTGAVATPTISRLADMFGKKRMMVIALVVMVLGSLLGALSQALPLIIAARALQGVGMALVPVGIAIMRDELPRDRVPFGVALMSTTLAIGAGAGPPLAGLLTAHLDWHAIFWVTGVIGSLLVAVVWLALSESPVRTGGSFDYRGALLLSGALTAFLLALSKGGQWGWASPITLSLAGLGLVLVFAWVPFELRVPHPVVDVRVAARPAVLLVNIASVLTGFAMFANMLVTTQLLQLPTSTGFGLGLGVLDTGLWMAPSALGFGAMAPVSAALTRRFGPVATLTAGALVMSSAYAGRVFLNHELWQIVAGSVIVAMGTSLTFSAMPTLIMRAVPVTESASANGLNTLLRSIGTSGSSATMAALATVGATTAGSVFPTYNALIAGFWLSAVLSLLAALLTIPMFRMGEYAAESEERGHVHDTVVRGRVLSVAGQPIRNAVVTLLTPSGEHVDWSQVDCAGDFSVAIPGAGRYVVVTAAEGWTAESRLVDLDAGVAIEPIVLAERLTVAGTVRDGRGDAVRDAVVALTREGGGVVGTATTSSGHYVMPLPANGRYVLTAITSSATTSLAITISGAGRRVDFELLEESIWADLAEPGSGSVEEREGRPAGSG
ncbi:MFS transporter [Spirillospora sp. CA-255316]